MVVRNEILSNQNYLFELILFDAYFYVANRKMSFVYIYNNRLVLLCILQYAILKCLLKFKKQDCYQISFDKEN